MLGLLNLLVQFVAIAVAIYVAIMSKFSFAVQLLVLVGVGHWLAMKLSNGLMWLHQKTMSPAELSQLMLVQYGGAAPRLWGWIATAVGIVYLLFACEAILWTLLRAHVL